MAVATVNQDRPPNFRDPETGVLYLVRCFACEPNHGRENWAPAVATGTCAWCGWSYIKWANPEVLDTLTTPLGGTEA
jgi:hypothetical protein